MKRRLKNFNDVRKAQASDYNLYCNGEITDDQARTRGYLLNQIRQTVLSQEGTKQKADQNQGLEDFKGMLADQHQISLDEFKRRFPINEDDLPPIFGSETEPPKSLHAVRKLL